MAPRVSSGKRERERMSASDEEGMERRQGKTNPLGEEKRQRLRGVKMDVSVEERGGELEEGERDSGGVRERRGAAEAKDVVFCLEREVGKRSNGWYDGGWIHC